MTDTNPDLVCRRVVEITTEYMEGALPAEESARFEQHLLVCAGCVHYVDHTRATIRTLGKLGGTEPPASSARESALRAFRFNRKGQGT